LESRIQKEQTLRTELIKVKEEDAEHRLTKASELCKRLTKELDELR